MSAHRFFHATLILLLAGMAVTKAHAAESYDNCTGFIDSVPATISSQGIWCLRHDLSTNITVASAIRITTNNVTIDCNDFKLGGLGAGDASQASGIYAFDQLNITVRHCNIRGFSFGIALSSNNGALIEDNRLDNNLYEGILVTGGNNPSNILVQRNRVFDTGGGPNSAISRGIVTTGDAIENTVSGVFATAASYSTTGIQASGDGSEVRGNRVRGLMFGGTGSTTGILVGGNNVTVDGNRVSFGLPGTSTGIGINGGSVNTTICTGNTIIRFSTPMTLCTDGGGNVSN